MQAAKLQRDYFFEFAGMPQSGKSTVERIVADYLRGQRFLIEEYRGGSRYSPLRFSSIADLNFLLACKASEFITSTSARGRTEHKIFLLERGLIDRCMFTDTLLHKGKIDLDTANATKTFLTAPQVLKKIDGVFAFVITPEVALDRENKDKLAKTGGEVMNTAFLSSMRSVVEADVEWARTLPSLADKHVELINTGEQNNGNEMNTAEDIVDRILSIVHRPVFSRMRH